MEIRCSNDFISIKKLINSVYQLAKFFFKNFMKEIFEIFMDIITIYIKLLSFLPSRRMTGNHMMLCGYQVSNVK